MKPGLKTSEFWLGLVAAILVYVNQSGIVGHPLPIEAIMGILTPIAGYIVSRGLAKIGK